MAGSDLLVKPVVTEGATVASVYLPGENHAYQWPWLCRVLCQMCIINRNGVSNERTPNRKWCAPRKVAGSANDTHAEYGLAIYSRDRHFAGHERLPHGIGTTG